LRASRLLVSNTVYSVYLNPERRCNYERLPLGPNVNSKCVACVDDDADVLKARRLLLEASGYSVVTATSGPELLRVLTDAGVVDVVLLDYLMPEMNGDELAKKLHEQYPQLPLVAVSAVPQLPDLMLGLVDATVQKGSDPKLLLSTIAEILSQPPKKPPQIQSVKATVLCVDDEEFQLRMRKRLFEWAGYRVLAAESAKEAFAIFLCNHIDAVVMDYWLSGIEGNGTALAEKIKRHRPKTPILMLSGFGALPGENAIVDLWLTKGKIEPRQLVAEVQRLIERHTAQQKDDLSEL
jgi:CheY-like chemotaxis protein